MCCTAVQTTRIQFRHANNRTTRALPQAKTVKQPYCHFQFKYILIAYFFQHCTICNIWSYCILQHNSQCAQDVLKIKQYQNFTVQLTTWILDLYHHSWKNLKNVNSSLMTVYRFSHGQLGYGGHVINFPQDTASFVNNLHNLSQLNVFTCSWLGELDHLLTVLHTLEVPFKVLDHIYD